MKNLKLTALEADELSKKAMKSINGGHYSCGCSCYYANQGGSSSSDNGNANYDSGLKSEKGENLEFVKTIR